jgi:hypothetical protein
VPNLRNPQAGDGRAAGKGLTDRAAAGGKKRTRRAQRRAGFICDTVLSSH